MWRVEDVTSPMIPNTNDSYQQLNGILNRITKVMMRKKNLKMEIM